jgi:hypothetical protein
MSNKLTINGRFNCQLAMHGTTITDKLDSNGVVHADFEGAIEALDHANKWHSLQFLFICCLDTS